MAELESKLHGETTDTAVQHMNWKPADHDKRECIPVRFRNFVSLVTETSKLITVTHLTVF